MMRWSLMVVLWGMFLFIPKMTLAQANLTVTIEPEKSPVKTTVHLIVTVSWSANAGKYLISPPELKLPESISIQKKSSETYGREGVRETRFKIDLLPLKKGEWTIDPIEVPYHIAGDQMEYRLKSDPMVLTVTSFSSRIIKGAVAGVVLIVLTTAGIIGVQRKKSKKVLSHLQALQHTDQSLSDALDACNRFKMEGNYGQFYESAQNIWHLFSEEQRSSLKDLDFAQQIESVKYGGIQPSAETIERVYRRLEQAVKSVISSDT